MQLFSLSPRWNTNNWNNNNNIIIRIDNDLRQKLDLLSWNRANDLPLKEENVYRKPSVLFQNFALFVGQPTNQTSLTFRQKSTVDVGVNTVSNPVTDVGVNTVDKCTIDVGVNTVNYSTTDIGVNTVNKCTTDAGMNTMRKYTNDIGTNTMNKSTTDVGINTVNILDTIDVAVNTGRKSPSTTIGVNTVPTPQPLVPSWLKQLSLTTSPILSLDPELPVIFVPSVERLCFWSPESSQKSALLRPDFEVSCSPYSSCSIMSSPSSLDSSKIMSSVSTAPLSQESEMRVNLMSATSPQFQESENGVDLMSASSSGSNGSYPFRVSLGVRAKINITVGTQTTPRLQSLSRAQIEQTVSMAAQMSTNTGTSVIPSPRITQGNQDNQNYYITGTEVVTRHATIPIVESSQVRFCRDLCGNYRVLGQGAYGAVYLAKLFNTGAELAIKFYSDTRDLVSHVLNEAMILSILQDSGFVPKLYGIMGEPSDTTKPTIIQEFFGQGKTLYSIMDGRDADVCLTREIKITIAFQLVFALKAIHDRGVLVNDIKSDNILVDTSTPEFRIRYIDFGLATYQSSFTYSNIVGNVFAMMLAPGQYDYLAPEVRMGCPTTPGSDLYSVGFLIGQLNCDELKQVAFMCCQEKPYHRPPIEKVLEFLDYLMSIT